jgi:hypothetical protein
MLKRTLLGIIALLVLLFSIPLNAGVWQTAVVDVDGDGATENIDYIIGEIGESNIPYSYYPPDFLGAFEVPRVHVGISGMEEVVLFKGIRVLDTGLPVLYGNLVYINTLYQSKNTVNSGEFTITTWTQDSLMLERRADIMTERAVIGYILYCNGNIVGKTAFIVPWNNGRTTISGATAYVDTMWGEYKADYAAAYNQTGSTDYQLNLSYSFDDYLGKISDDFILGWDDGSPAIYGMGFLPAPDSASVVNGGACSNMARVSWSLKKDAAIPATVRIEPEHVNVNANGLVTGFVCLPAPYGFEDIDLSTVTCAGAPARVKEQGNDGCVVLKFERADLAYLPDGENILTIKGRLYNGLQFEGSDTVEIFHSRNGKDGGRNVVFPVLKPNPFTNKITFEIPVELTTGSEMPVIKIYNLAGQVIRKLTNLSQDASLFRASWDGKDENGLKVAAGTYLYRLTSGGRAVSGKILFLR